jgi:hypothetical protein
VQAEDKRNGVRSRRNMPERDLYLPERNHPLQWRLRQYRQRPSPLRRLWHRLRPDASLPGRVVLPEEHLSAHHDAGMPWRRLRSVRPWVTLPL